MSDSWQRLVIDFNKLERVFGKIAIDGNNDRYRLADIAHAADGDRPAFDRRLDADHQRGRKLRHLFSGDDGGNARRTSRGFGADCADFGVRMRRAQNGGVQRARRDADIVDVASAPGEKREVLDPFDGLAEPASVVRLFTCLGQNATPPGAIFLTNPRCAQAARGASRQTAPRSNEAPFPSYCIDAGFVAGRRLFRDIDTVSYTHLRAHETGRNLVCRLLLEKKKNQPT